MLSSSWALALLLLLLAPVSPAAAASPNVILHAAVTDASLTITYTPDGKVSHNQTQTQPYTKDYKSSQLFVSDNQQEACWERWTPATISISVRYGPHCRAGRREQH